MFKEEKIPKLNVTRKELSEILQTYTRKEICSNFGISERTFDRIIHDQNLNRQNFGPKNICDQTVFDIRLLYQTGRHKQKDLAEKFNVSQSLISKIINNQVHRRNGTLKVSGEAGVRLESVYGD